MRLGTLTEVEVFDLDEYKELLMADVEAAELGWDTDQSDIEVYTE